MKPSILQLHREGWLVGGWISIIHEAISGEMQSFGPCLLLRRPWVNIIMHFRPSVRPLPFGYPVVCRI